MFVYSLKASRLKAGALLLLVSAAIVTAAISLYRPDTSEAVSARGTEIRFDGIKSEEDLLGFISSLGLEVKTPAYRSIDVDLPRVFDAVYSKYNDIQKQQGLDLSKYRGKTLHRYTYEVINYPVPDNTADGKVYLTLFVYKNKVVGGDISSRDFGGFVHTILN